MFKISRVTGDDDQDDRGGEDSAGPTPWHNSTAKLLGASVAGLAAIALIVAGVTTLSRQDDQPQDAPANFVESTFSRSETSDSATPTTSTAITTGPIVTTEIDPASPSLTPPPATSVTGTTTSESRPPRVDRDQDDTPRTTRSRPRLNETRTLYPRPGG